MRPRLAAAGLALLVPAALVAAGRSSLALAGVAEPSWYWVLFALGGSLSGVGLLLLVVASWRTRAVVWVLAGAAMAFLGHYVIPWLGYGSNASLVHLGTGAAVAPWNRWALLAGAVAALGAILRPEGYGHLLLAAGASGVATAAVIGIVSLWPRQAST